MDELNNHKDKIIKLFNNTSRDNLDNGMQWYSDANMVALLLSVKHNIHLNKVVGIMAALSPNNKWDRNKLDTELFLSNPSLETKVCTFMNQRKKALEIYHGNGKVTDIENILKGIKTVNFFNNILYFDSCDRVTVDMWAFRSVEVEAKTKNIEMVTRAYREVARYLEIQPHQLQAVVWGVIRGSLV